MTYLLTHYWGWLLIVVGVGLVGAQMAHRDEKSNRLPIWFFIIAGLLTLGVLADFDHVVNGRPALWLETAALSCIAFAVGAFVGDWLGGGASRARGLWWGPFMVGALIWACSNALLLGPTETALRDRAKAAAAAVGGAAADVDIAGRDALLAAGAGDAAKRLVIADRILQEDGIRQVDEVAGGANAAQAGAADKNAGSSIADKKAAAVAAAKALSASGPLSSADCQTALSGLVAGESVKYDTGSSRVSSELEKPDRKDRRDAGPLPGGGEDRSRRLHRRGRR